MAETATKPKTRRPAKRKVASKKKAATTTVEPGDLTVPAVEAETAAAAEVPPKEEPEVSAVEPVAEPPEAEVIDEDLSPEDELQRIEALRQMSQDRVAVRNAKAQGDVEDYGTIRVIATQDGYYKGHRKMGDKFEISKEPCTPEEMKNPHFAHRAGIRALGKWMAPATPANIEAVHQEISASPTPEAWSKR